MLIKKQENTCQSSPSNMPNLTKKDSPFSWTTFTIGFQASTCSDVQIPGVFGNLQKIKIKINFPIKCKKIKNIDHLGFKRDLNFYPIAVSEKQVASDIRRAPLLVLCE